MKNNKVIAIIKHNGIILCENNNEIKLPFGQEYSILIKNLENKKIKTNISINNKYVVNDLIINANSKVELKKIFKDKNEYEILQIEFKYQKDKLNNDILYKDINNKSNYINNLVNAINKLNPQNELNLPNENITLKDPIDNNYVTTLDFENNLNIMTFKLKGYIESNKKSNTTIINSIKNKTTFFSQKICPNCGIKNGRLDRHCFECGTPLK